MKLQSKEALVIHSLSDYQSFSPVLRDELQQIAGRVDQQYRDRAELLTALRNSNAAIGLTRSFVPDRYWDGLQSQIDLNNAAISKAESTN